MQPSTFQNTQNEREYLNYCNQWVQDMGFKYSKPRQTIQLLPNTQILNPNDQTRKLLYQTGLKYLKSKNPFAVILFVGGYGCRSQLDGCKQFQQLTLYNNKTNLFKIAIKSLEHFFNDQEWEMTLYIVCNRKNSALINQQLERINIKYPNAVIYVCYQPDQNVLSWNGLQTIFKSPKVKQKLTYPGGIGAFKKAKIYYDGQEQYTLKQHILEIIKPKYVYCLGISNVLEKGINYQMIGLMEHKNLSCVFKCSSLTIPNKIQAMSLICTRQHKQSAPAWIIMQHSNLKKLVKNQQQIRNYPVWQDNFVFNTRVLSQAYPANPSEMKIQFNLRTLNNRSTNQKIQCIIPEATVSYAVMRDKANCIGYIGRDQFSYFMKTAQNFKFTKQFQIAASPSKIFKKKTI